MNTWVLLFLVCGADGYVSDRMTCEWKQALVFPSEGACLSALRNERREIVIGQGFAVARCKPR